MCLATYTFGGAKTRPHSSLSIGMDRDEHGNWQRYGRELAGFGAQVFANHVLEKDRFVDERIKHLHLNIESYLTYPERQLQHDPEAHSVRKRTYLR